MQKLWGLGEASVKREKYEGFWRISTINTKTRKFSDWFAGEIAKPAVIISISLSILSIGIIFEFFFPQWEVSAFSRAGSILVAFAILCVFVNHTLRGVVEENADFLRLLKKSIKGADERGVEKSARKLLEDKKYRDLMNLGDDVDALVSEAVDDFVTARETYTEKSQTMVDNYTKVSSRLSVTEAIAGITGTLVWGFGDLLFKIFR